MKNLEERIEELRDDIKYFELDPYDFEEQYQEFLNCGGSVNVCGLEFIPSDILMELDPVAYRCGLNDYVDSLDVEESEEYREMVEELEDLEQQLEDEDDN